MPSGCRRWGKALARAHLGWPPGCRSVGLIEHLNLESSIFRSNHASNTLALKGVFPKDREALLEVLDEVLEHPDRAPFIPNWLRAL